ncbi:MAG: phosphotransferase, partial [Chloroflexota bacterium]
LDATPFGPSVEHGDLSPGQVIVGEMGPVVLDWSDSTITHPFLAAASFLIDPADLPATLGDDVASTLAAAYLAGWGGGPDIARALDLATVVYPLHLVRLYADRVLPGLEQPWEMERMIPWALQRLERRLPDLPRILGR